MSSMPTIEDLIGAYILLPSTSSSSSSGGFTTAQSNFLIRISEVYPNLFPVLLKRLELTEKWKAAKIILNSRRGPPKRGPSPPPRLVKITEEEYEAMSGKKRIPFKSGMPKTKKPKLSNSSSSVGSYTNIDTRASKTGEATEPLFTYSTGDIKAAYAAFGLTKTSITRKALDAEFRKRMAAVHPDKNRDNIEEATRDAVRLNRHYDILKSVLERTKGKQGK